MMLDPTFGFFIISIALIGRTNHERERFLLAYAPKISLLLFDRNYSQQSRDPIIQCLLWKRDFLLTLTWIYPYTFIHYNNNCLVFSIWYRYIKITDWKLDNSRICLVSLYNNSSLYKYIIEGKHWCVDKKKINILSGVFLLSIIFP